MKKKLRLLGIFSLMGLFFSNVHANPCKAMDGLWAGQYNDSFVSATVVTTNDGKKVMISVRNEILTGFCTNGSLSVSGFSYGRATEKQITLCVYPTFSFKGTASCYGKGSLNLYRSSKSNG